VLRITNRGYKGEAMKRRQVLMKVLDVHLRKLVYKPVADSQDEI